MASGGELPEIPDLPREDSSSKRRLSVSSDKERVKPIQVSKRPNVRPSTSRSRQKEWLDESPNRDRSTNRNSRQRISETAAEAKARKEADRLRKENIPPSISNVIL